MKALKIDVVNKTITEIEMEHTKEIYEIIGNGCHTFCAPVEFDNQDTLFADDEFKLGQVRDVLLGKLAKRQVDVRFLKDAKKEKISGDKIKQLIEIQKGIQGDLAKKVVRMIKDSKIKVQASIQGDAIRVTGAKRDDLQAVMTLLRKDVTEAPLSFNNFRD